MSKADVIEIEGKVVEKLPNAMFQVELENGTTSAGAYQRKAPHEFYPHFTRRQGHRTDVALRPDPRPYHLAFQVSLGGCAKSVSDCGL